MFKLFNSTNQDEPSKSRRRFFKGAASAGVVLVSTGGVAAVLSKDKTQKDYQTAYDKDVLPGDTILQQNGFEEIDHHEKEKIIQTFIEDYDKKRQV